MPIRRHTIGVEIPGRRYDVTVQRGLLQQAGQLLRSLSASAKVGVVTDSHVGPLHLAVLEQSLRQAGISPLCVTLPAGEEHKTLEHLLPAYGQLLSAGIERSTPILALGGGVIGDMTGFLAATILRGVPFVQVPTSLLAMVDASVGGKTAINHPVGKNLIGAFHQPIAVLIDPDVLASLPPRELHGGLAECIKHEIIRDAQGFAALERNIARAVALDLDYLADLVAHNVTIKARVVAADPLEKGERAHLNLGHTFGHAIEIVGHHRHSHGEAVSLGTAAASFIARELGLLHEADRLRILRLFEQAQLPTAGLDLDLDQLLQAMRFDKKVHAGQIRFILPRGLGNAVIRNDIPESLTRAALQSVLK